MADRWLFVVAVEKYLDTTVGTVPYAESGARGLAEALAGAGYPKTHHVTLFGSQATKAIVESRLRRLKRILKKDDELLVFIAARGFAQKGRGFIACWDTQWDDVAEMSLSTLHLFKELHATKASQITVLFDIGSGAPLEDFEPHLYGAELKHVLSDSRKITLLAVTGTDEESHATASFKATLGTHLLTEAFAGRGVKAINKDGSVTALSLHGYLEDELPRLLRKHFDSRAAQSPQLYGEHNAANTIADLSRLVGHGQGGNLLDADRLKRVLFRSETQGRVKDLTGFRKGFQTPDNASASSRKFIAKLATADVKIDLDAVFEAIREHLGYKRKEVDVSAEGDGTGMIRTPDFEYTVRAELDPTDSARVAWCREVTRFINPGFIRSPGFETVFGKSFDQLVFEFATPIDVEALVDRLEDSPPKGVKITVASNGASCDIALTGFTGRVVVDRNSLIVRGRAGNSAGLLDQFLAFLQTVGPLGEPLMLPG